jgi:16S rRNA (cytosine967-C5)-methyltransferase
VPACDPESVLARADPARQVAYDLLRAVDADGAYANLRLPALLTARGLSGRDAAFATELGYGTLRAAGTLDEVIAACSDRAPSTVEAPVRDLLRLGAYQALRTRVPPHAAVATTVDLAKSTGHGRAAGFLNAVLRRIARDDWSTWTEQLTSGASPLRRLAVETAHPEWIAAAFRDALGESSAGDLAQTAAALRADDLRPSTHLVAWPGGLTRAELVRQSGGTPGPWSPYAVHLNGGDPGQLIALRSGQAGVQDEGSQLCALALAQTPIDGSDERWLDLCAGPGGKTALLAALAADRGATVVANELRPHRAELVRQATTAWNVAIQVGDAREYPDSAPGFDRVLVDAPCTGLGALRRRPEARWRRGPGDLPPLVTLQGELLAAGLRLARPGGVVAYVTCSPHRAETTEIVAGAVAAGHELLDARPDFPGVPELGDGPTVQLWPHRHGTDAMFCALIARH